MGHSFMLEANGVLPYAIHDMIKDELAKVQLLQKRQGKYRAKKLRKKSVK